MASFLDGIDQDILFLSKVPPIQGIIRAREGNGIDEQGNSTYDVWVKRLSIIFSAMIESKNYYLKLRYIDENGTEMVRFYADGNKIKFTGKANWQNKKSHPYFQETMKLAPGELYISPVNLNRENGVISHPYQPVIRYARPIFDLSGNRKGIVIANVSAKDAIHLIKNSNLGEGTKAFIVNQNGYYIYHHNRSK